MQGERIESVEARRPDLRRPLPEDLRQRLTGARVEDLGRRGKYGLVHTDRGDTLVFHLGMSGRWRIDPADIGAHDHLLIGMGSGTLLSLNDPRRFGSVDLARSDALSEYPPFAAMGPEPLSEALTGRHLKEAFKGRSAPIKALLLDQQVVAGLGNIYVCEALHIAGITPATAAGRVSLARLDRLTDAIKSVLLSAIEAGGSTLRDYARPDGELGYFAKQWRVYGREGEACACGSPVRRRVDGGRSTFFCSKCQR
jgi:formamidopyrimidine-DNA glycosylase